MRRLRDYHVRRGIESGYPRCCVAWFTMLWSLFPGYQSRLVTRSWWRLRKAASSVLRISPEGVQFQTCPVHAVYYRIILCLGLQDPIRKEDP